MIYQWTNDALQLIEEFVKLTEHNEVIWKIIDQVDPLTPNGLDRKSLIIETIETTITNEPVITTSSVLILIDHSLNYLCSLFVEAVIPVDRISEMYPVYILHRYSGLDRKVLCKFLQGNRLLADIYPSARTFPFQDLIAEGEMVDESLIDANELNAVRYCIGPQSPTYLTKILLAMIAIIGKEHEAPVLDINQSVDDIKKYLRLPYIQYLMLMTDVLINAG